jgi:hypothetical protein
VDGDELAPEFWGLHMKPMRASIPGIPRKIVGFHHNEFLDWVATWNAVISSMFGIIRHRHPDIG